ncbi:MAG: bifunctional [glutamine synthetase] adenylyltransferase/[glutamine synthetase]-adenylyl-L-tyrosine phosphorylase [Hyphomonadaceae bacterium]|nr:bifunctional [glutamine synthetase] adenylyltransferase/[glutamine synthetase]-adenylyl-L-tyrosine phosphorylase [Hyphomonadaceae bacterium]
MRAVTSAIVRSTSPTAGYGDWSNALAAASEHAPYLRRLIGRRDDLLAEVEGDWPTRMLDLALAEAHDVEESPPPIAEAMLRLRYAKDIAHLAIAVADLSRAWPLLQVTGALTRFADAALRAALAVAVRECDLGGGDAIQDDGDGDEGPIAGFSLIAMGKMGAGELNYSSDIDFSVFFDSERLIAGKAREPRVAAVRLVSPLVRVLQEVTAEGYVFRTDLRLRPDPGSTPVAVSIAAAEHYYQTLGQNWERAAFIKARAAAGDRATGRAFLQSLEPFIWRKHLDFAAVEDVHSIKRQILSTHKSAELDDPVFDVKLGRGGIRDIELFAQTQQLILGGRNRKLRGSGTLAALDALAAAGAISGDARDALHEAYVFFREVEHRIQMLEDAQTHQAPRDPEARARVAALAGFESLAEFDAALVMRRMIVSEIDHKLFGRGESLADPLGSLIFTGVEDHAETLSTIGKLGFSDPTYVSQAIRGWHHGRIRAMRSERARELLTRLTPKLLRALAAAGEADDVFKRFEAFFASLGAGVQLLSLLEARPAFLDLFARVLSVAPRLAGELAKRPALLDALTEPEFLKPLRDDRPNARLAELGERLASESGFEAKLNAARRYQREAQFRVGVQLIEGLVEPGLIAGALSELADACVHAMAQAALEETERLYGAQPGAFAVLALGKLGGRELAQGSDLDIMVVYDSPDLSSGDFYTRLTQRLISALSAPTEEGALYEIDTKLRPSGSKGPVAVRLSSFERYYNEDAWTWELQALTRLRPVAGDVSLGRRASDIARDALSRSRGVARVLTDVREMRALMERERPAQSHWDFKLTPGGFVDIEFAVQALLLTAGQAFDARVGLNTGEAILRFAEQGLLSTEDADALMQAWRFQSDLQHALRVCLGPGAAPESFPIPLRQKLATLAGVADFAEVEPLLKARQAAAREVFMEILDRPATDR